MIDIYYSGQIKIVNSRNLFIGQIYIFDILSLMEESCKY